MGSFCCFARAPNAGFDARFWRVCSGVSLQMRVIHLAFGGFGLVWRSKRARLVSRWRDDLLERCIASDDLFSARVSHFAHFWTLVQMGYCVRFSDCRLLDISADCVLR